MIRNAWVPDGAQEDRVEWAQLLDTVCGHHLSGFDISFTTPIERVPVEPESKALSCRFQDSNTFWHTFDWSCETYVKTGKMMPADGIQQLRPFDSIFLGAVGHPSVRDHVSLWGLLIPVRRHFRQY